MGHLITLLYILNMNDLHVENIIAYKDYPVIIDGETLFHNEHNLDFGDKPYAKIKLHISSETLMQSRLLPYSVEIPDDYGNLIDLSGISGGNKGILVKGLKPVGSIDFDVAGPGPRLWDIAYTLYTCVPLSRVYHTETGEAVYYNSLQHADRIKQRVKLFFESYGEGMEEDYLEMVLLRLEGLCKYMKRKAKEGDMNFQKMIDEGHLEHYQNDITFIREHGKEWI
ncbi:hypothetical protein DJ93_5604 [Bacillus clarus]|uniref:Lantibiotic biosynthesis protein dehydration domain-containing protein n=2 Tax=Bacillus clarus TaxID=2338372 RepID=A0A090YBV2_9BACI|nr:hypothetical protein DJ93_5604 [Bacillus clarus]